MVQLSTKPPISRSYVLMPEVVYRYAKDDFRVEGNGVHTFIFLSIHDNSLIIKTAAMNYDSLRSESSWN